MPGSLFRLSPTAPLHFLIVLPSCSLLLFCSSFSAPSCSLNVPILFLTTPSPSWKRQPSILSLRYLLYIYIYTCDHGQMACWAFQVAGDHYGSMSLILSLLRWHGIVQYQICWEPHYFVKRSIVPTLPTVEVWATNSTAIEANQTLLRILCYMPAGGNEAIQGLYKMLAGLLLVSGQHLERSRLRVRWHRQQERLLWSGIRLGLGKGTAFYRVECRAGNAFLTWNFTRLLSCQWTTHTAPTLRD